MEITVNIICALFGGVFGWFVAHTCYREQKQRKKTKTDDIVSEDSSVIKDDILLPLAAKTSEAMREWRKRETIFPIDIGQEGAAASSLDLTFLNEYITEPKIGSTPSPVVRSVRNIIKAVEHYNEGCMDAALRAKQTATEGFDHVQKQCNKYLFVGLNKIWIEQRQYSPDVYLQSYLENEHNYSKFCPYIFGDRKISTSGLKTRKSMFSDKETELEPLNIESVIAARKNELEEYGYNAQQIKDELWYMFVMRDIFDKESEISREIRNYVKEAALREEFDSIAALLDDMKAELGDGTEEEAGKIRRKSKRNIYV